MAVYSGFFGKGRRVLAGRSLANWLLVLVMAGGGNLASASTLHPPERYLVESVEDSILTSYGLDGELFNVWISENGPILQLNKTYIGKKVVLKNLTFTIPVSIEGVVDSGLTIKSCVFQEYLSIAGATFLAPLVIHSSSFSRTIFLTRSGFEEVFITSCDIKGLQLLESKVNRLHFVKCGLENTSIYGLEILSHTLTGLLFRGTSLYSPFEFSNCNFENVKEISFANSELCAATESPMHEFAFENCKLSKELVLDNVRNACGSYTGLLNFKSSDAKGTTVRLSKTNADVVTLNYVDATPYFDEYHEENLRVTINKFGSTESKENLDALNFQLQQAIAANKSGFWPKFFAEVEYIWWGFGYRRGNIILCTLVLFVICWLFIWLTYNTLSTEVYVLDPLKYASGTGTSLKLANAFKPLFYSIFIFFGLSVKLDKIHFNKPFRVLFLLFVYLLGLFCTASVITYVVSL